MLSFRYTLIRFICPREVLGFLVKYNLTVYSYSSLKSVTSGIYIVGSL